MTGIEEGAAIAALAEAGGTAAAAEGAAAGGTALAAEGALGSAALDAAVTDALWNAGTAGLLEYGGGYEGVNMLATQGLLDSAALNTLEGASAMEGLQPVMNDQQAAELLRQQGMQGLADYGTPLSMDGVQMTQAIKDATPWYDYALYKAQGFANQLGSKEGKLAMNGAQKLMQGNQQQKQQQPQILPQAPMDAGGFTGRPAQSFQQFSPYVGGFSGFRNRLPIKNHSWGNHGATRQF